MILFLLYTGLSCYMLIIPGLTFVTQYVSFLGLYLNTLDMSVSLHSDILLEIWQLANTLLQTQSVSVSWVMSFLCQWPCTASLIMSYH